ncbi:hypothetical protein [Neorhizobium petrolearium]|uniref:Uncharacterized protein n=1 Tax=Neorhizobium petrolearium TaxID=515361 RepID=A0ABY8M2F1_9HYPH|nr:hypothetical protein [Neorhizobium petrolearium]MCC2608450.1 hypothetical protein [Neorhizobium petrolearium]WGI68725.1 hypothetical protein QEO92_01090 [Neorhizobium petrolearium]
MALSEAEWKRREEEEDAEPWYFGMTWGEFRRLPERKQHEIRQRVTQFGATHVGFWKDCALGKCRRAKRCVGFLSDAQYKAGYNAAYPPCARGEETRRAKILYDGLEKLFPSRNDEPKYAGRPSDGVEEC